MSSVELVPELYARVEQIAQARNTTVNTVLDEAVKHYLWEIQREIISNETRMYRAKHAALKEKYLGHFIAMRDGQIVDSDQDLHALRTRVRARFGFEPILMTKVEENADPMMMKHGFSLEMF